MIDVHEINQLPTLSRRIHHFQCLAKLFKLNLFFSRRRPQSISSEDGRYRPQSSEGSFRSAGSGCAKLKRQNACRQKNRDVLIQENRRTEQTVSVWNSWIVTTRPHVVCKAVTSSSKILTVIAIDPLLHHIVEESWHFISEHV